MQTLRNKVTIITGASRGIGYATAQLFEENGARLVLTAKENLDALDVFTSAEKVRLDLTSEDTIDYLVKKTIKNFGCIDIFINNAGVFTHKDFELITAKELTEMIDIGLKGPFMLLQKIVGQMKQQKKGKIVNVSSLSGRIGSSGATHYAAVKAGIIALTKSLARSYGKHNIVVNSIAPSLIETDMLKHITKERLKNLIESIPLKRLGRPEEVAMAILFLASDTSDYITGQTLCIDGGLSML
ncbi:MAG: hypothetical protein A2Y00_08780 [Omnitrophica WOR_2 bacterium GWF2_43_52]|nr:MAG: hypothetical protein A2Y00_08780 [Omnitrophica WOR_2 bacterium GWF2_43_52]OGX53409.1 MAG: hypothetical protein A2460_03415 [Omnitrophica WOR_2 bacterium RIFOXYC2_FULL_43_9]HAH20372.1 beta-ketoacyl-ACP reductase [Candidatus Omnitrophota bacterium]HBG62855.1 beta-ketoacyl-ACP reductase [Candidatus Omnitrophota bacterium]